MSEEYSEFQPTPLTDSSDNTSDYKTSIELDFKKVCTRIGLMIIVIFGSRIAAELLAIPLANWLVTLDTFSYYLFNAVYSCLFLYAIPIVATVFILRRPLKNSPNKVYQKPKYFGKAMAMFPAGYGLAITVRMLTMLLSMLFEGTALGDSFNVVQDSLFAAPDISTALIQFVQLAVIAPIVEELWFRGLVMESLRPYGNGFAIFVSAILFGLTHANLEQFFYAAALGVFLGYIAIATESIVTTTIMHAIFNSMSGVMLLLSVEPSVQDYVLGVSNEQGVEPSTTPFVVLYLIWTALIMLLLVVGIIMMIAKLVKIKKYKVPKMQTELSSGRRWGIFFSRAAVIVGLVLAIIVFAEPVILSGIQKLYAGSAAMLLR